MSTLKPGDSVVYYSWEARKMHQPSRQQAATVIKIGKLRVTIELEGGKRLFVQAENLVLAKQQTKNQNDKGQECSS